MSVNIYEKLTNWMSENYEPLSDWLYFNATTMEDGNVSLLTSEGMDASSSFIDGSKEVDLLFAIAMIKEYSSEMSTTNLDAIAEVDNFIQWLHEQNRNGSFPDFGDGYTVFEIQVLDATPSIAVDTSQNLAKYQFNCSINFLKEKEI